MQLYIHIYQSLKFYLEIEMTWNNSGSCKRSHGVMVSTLDSESSDPSSNLGGTFFLFYTFIFLKLISHGILS